MKPIKVLLIALSLLAMSCKKEEVKPESKGNVEYIITCNNCTAVIKMSSGEKSFKINEDLSVFDSSSSKYFYVLTKGMGDSRVNIKLNEYSVYYATKSMSYNGGQVIHSVDISK